MRLLLAFSLFSTLLWGVISWMSDHDTRDRLVFDRPAQVSLEVHGIFLGMSSIEGKTVTDALAEYGLSEYRESLVLLSPETKLVSGMRIALEPKRTITLQVDGTRRSLLTNAKTSADILGAEHITLDEDDIVEPAREIVVAAGSTLRVTRVEIREEHKDTVIDYATEVAEDDTLSWRTKRIVQKGEKGTKRTTYRVSYHDGKEVRRKVVGTETLKEPVPEKVTQGTYVKLGKSHRGAASWYAWTGTMAAANPWLPKGSYVKVTNLDNGKSVIVVINDRGPFVPGRIIDLDKVAFAKIASIGAGVINVKMEEIVN